LLGGVLQFGSVTATIAWLQGYAICPDASAKDLGTIQAGVKHSAAFRLRNLASQPVTVIGAEASCYCTVVGSLPLTIPPGEEREVAVFVLVGDYAVGTSFEQSVELILDTPGPPPVLTVSAQVVQGPTKNKLGVGSD
jgi:hypothetical protein